MSITSPLSLVPNPAPLCPPFPDGQFEPVVAGEVHARNDVYQVDGWGAHRLADDRVLKPWAITPAVRAP